MLERTCFGSFTNRAIESEILFLIIIYIYIYIPVPLPPLSLIVSFKFDLGVLAV